jgi:assimilatory nitrate reductase electron transfer subunit
MPRRGPATAAPSPAVLPARATICQCNGVTKAAICSAWEDGARSTNEIAQRTRATTGCGSCKVVVEGLVEWLAESDPSEDTLVSSGFPGSHTEFVTQGAVR